MSHPMEMPACSEPMDDDEKATPEELRPSITDEMSNNELAWCKSTSQQDENGPQKSTPSSPRTEPDGWAPDASFDRMDICDDADQVPSECYDYEEPWAMVGGMKNMIAQPADILTLFEGDDDEDERLQAVLQAIERHERGLPASAVSGQGLGAMSESEEVINVEDVCVLDCSDEIWEEILEGTEECPPIWGDEGTDVIGRGESHEDSDVSASGG
ncbi:hypothetical protein C2857_005291 [Epichloe festucae Fl1]|uniref:Uncharacterized protein n=1 Tax=Epichloe festucae (strain Fl1) TaxID=877507 RepID=A0A7S9KSM9_EPIFF|nr:hypothetical protein C2857_005291 [Epichloe festucae Fl1]